MIQLGVELMSRKVYRLNAFAKTEDGGNPAGVVIDAEHLSANQMQAIAKEVGYSETAFVMKSDKADFRVRFFTPTNEVDLCGHATIATFNLLRDLGIVAKGQYTQETKAGVLKIAICEDEVFMEQKLPEFDQILNHDEIIDSFNCQGVSYLN